MPGSGGGAVGGGGSVGGGVVGTGTVVAAGVFTVGSCVGNRITVLGPPTRTVVLSAAVKFAGSKANAVAFTSGNLVMFPAMMIGAAMSRTVPAAPAVAFPIPGGAEDKLAAPAPDVTLGDMAGTGLAAGFPVKTWIWVRRDCAAVTMGSLAGAVPVAVCASRAWITFSARLAS